MTTEIQGRLQHFEIVRDASGGFVELGRGAMGVTFRALDTILKREVALKLINPALLAQPSSRQRFLREARAAAALRHPNVATVLHLGEEQGTYFYVMELIEGRTLDRCVQQDGAFAPDAALDIALQVCRALAAAERHGLVHRDIKPSNIMLLEQDGERLVKVIDFGLAKLTGADPGSTLGGMTTGGVLGTPHFASPEQLNEQAVDIRSDFYSLAATLWFMLRGRPPFSGPVARIIGQHLSAAFPFDELPDVSGTLREVLERLSAKNPEARPQTTSELRRMLETALAACRNPAVSMPPAMEPGVEEALVAGRFRRGAPLGMRDGLPAQEGVDFASGLEAILYETPEDAVEFLAAARRIAGSPHPNLLAVLAVDPPWIARPKVEGATLLEVLRVRQGLPVNDALLVLDAVATALDHACGIGVGTLPVHPSSVWLLPARPGPDPHLAATPFDQWGGMDIVVDMLPPPPADASVTMLPGESPAAAGRESGGERSPQRVLVALLAELLGEPEAGGKGRFVPLASLGEGANAIVRAVFDKPGAFSNGTALVKALAQACRTLLPGVSAQVTTGVELLYGQTPESPPPSGQRESGALSRAGMALVPLPRHLRERYSVRHALSAFAPGQRRFHLVTLSEPPQTAVLIHSLYSTPLAADEVRRLEDVARRMLTAPHPAFCRALDFSVSPHDSALVTESPGEMTLHDALSRAGRLDYDHAIRQAGVLADACEAAAAAGWPRAPLETRSIFALVLGHDLSEGLTLRIPCPGLPQSGREEIDPFATLAFAAARPGDDFSDSTKSTPALVELICAMLGQPLRIHGRGGFRPVPELSADQNARLRRAFEAAAERHPPSPSEIVRNLGGRPSSWRTSPGVQAAPEGAPPISMVADETVTQGEHDVPAAAGVDTSGLTPAERLRLLPAQSGRWPVISLSAAPGFILGRSPKDADFIATFLPRSPANDSRTMKIGRQQLRMDFHHGAVTLSDVGATNASRWNDRVPNGERMALREEELLLAGEYPVRLVQVAARPLDVLRLAGRTVARPPGAAGCVMAEPVQRAGAFPCLGIWIFTEAGLRMDEGASAIVASGDAGRGAMVMLHHAAGVFWLENIALSGVRIAETEIPPGRCAPLRPGDSLFLGPAEYEVAAL